MTLQGTAAKSIWYPFLHNSTLHAREGNFRGPDCRRSVRALSLRMCGPTKERIQECSPGLHSLHGANPEEQTAEWLDSKFAIEQKSQQVTEAESRRNSSEQIRSESCATS